jgi:hypothetical protein
MVMIIPGHASVAFMLALTLVVALEELTFIGRRTIAASSLALGLAGGIVFLRM